MDSTESNLFLFILLEIWKKIVKIKWTSKGHLEYNETDFEAAIRETEEEAGLVLDKDYICIDKSKIFEAIYPVKRGEKRVAYFIGCVLPSAKVQLSSESSKLKWLTLTEMKNFIKFRSELLCPMFEQAENYLIEKI